METNKNSRLLTGDINLSESMEDYIEAIGKLQDNLKVVRVKNIAKAMKVKMPSVSSALGVLEKKGLVNYEKYDYVELTDRGKKIANVVRMNHAILKRFLMEVLDVEENKAERDSCGMEHHISKATLDNLIKFVEFITKCPGNKNLILREFRKCLKTGINDK